jgi:hypothetical protein
MIDVCVTTGEPEASPGIDGQLGTMRDEPAESPESEGQPGTAKDVCGPDVGRPGTFDAKDD